LLQIKFDLILIWWDHFPSNLDVG